MSPTTIFYCRSGAGNSAAYPAGVSLAGSLPEVAIAGEGSIERQAMEAFIATEFRQQYNASIKTFMPWLLGLSCDDRLAGVAGLRPAGHDALFVERYLDRHIEDEVSLHTGLPVARRQVIEIGNLAGHYPGVTRALFPLLTELTYSRGYQWCVCNTTQTVQNALLRLSIPIVPMARAIPERLGADRFAWGNYYASETTVIAISTVAAHDALLNKPVLASACALALAGHYSQLPVA